MDMIFTALTMQILKIDIFLSFRWSITPTLSCGLSGQVRSTVNNINATTAQLRHEVKTKSLSGLFHRGDHDPRICVCSSHH